LEFPSPLQSFFKHTHCPLQRELVGS
jgi:hypothetical protein